MSGIDKNIMDVLRERADGGVLSYRDYIDCVLYAPGAGYYRRPAERVGRSAESDFYTAESLGAVFARLVVSAAVELIGPAEAGRSGFVEIAAEPGRELLASLDGHPFASGRVIRHGDPLRIEGPSIVFANEWLDALPFHRLVFHDGQWRERGVRVGDGLEECLLDALSPAVAAVAGRLPADASEGYELDLPLEAETTLAGLVRQDWTGLLLLFDYGKSWAALSGETPRGTARCFRKHRQTQDLLERPGVQDITCDVCWDPLQAVLGNAGLRSVTLESQESFFVRRAHRAAEAIVRDSAGSFSPDRQTLMELIHPAHMGQRFQVLWGLR